MEGLQNLNHFSFERSDLLSLYYLNKMVENVVHSTRSDNFDCEIDYASPDNFGIYASGYRCNLKNKANGKSLYIYFGTIYSYKKTPAGIFAEVDEFNNKEHYKDLWEKTKESAHYKISRKEPPFLKLFLSEPMNSVFVEGATVEEQEEALEKFFKACCEAFVDAIA